MHIPQTWAAARYHSQAKNRLKAAEFGRDAFRILDWAQSQPGLAETVVQRGKDALALPQTVSMRVIGSMQASPHPL